MKFGSQFLLAHEYEIHAADKKDFTKLRFQYITAFYKLLPTKRS